MDSHTVVGIDFGMTASGAAYATFHDFRPKPINFEATVKSSDEAEDEIMIQSFGNELRVGFIDDVLKKTETMLYYDRSKESGGKLRGWSTQSGTTEDLDQKVMFKSFLDPVVFVQYQQEGSLNPNMPSCLHHGVQWCTDFLRVMIAQILAKLDYPPHIQFFCTIPSAWVGNDSIIQNFKQCMRGALNACSPSKHTIAIGLTEPMAAAVYQVRSHPEDFRVGDVLLSCDAGGGTTDISTLKLLADFSLEELDTIDGISVGSCKIDIAFLKHLKEQGIQIPPNKCNKFLKVFEPYKHGFTGENSNQPRLEIEDRELYLSFETLKSWFDEVISQICVLLYAQLKKLKGSYPKQKIMWMLLSGGLNQNQYVVNCLRRNYEKMDCSFPTHRDIRIIQSSAPVAAPTLGQVYHVLTSPREAVKNWGLVMISLDSAPSGSSSTRPDASFMDKKVTCLIKKGTCMPSNAWYKYERSIHRRYVTLYIVTCVDDLPQRTQDGVEFCGEINISVNDKISWLHGCTLTAYIRIFDYNKIKLRISATGHGGKSLGIDSTTKRLGSKSRSIEVEKELRWSDLIMDGRELKRW